ncbi:NUDIX domain-containing protein [Pelagibacterium luteolum]|uniref:8-oxo-dGTP pyrophosphatase MutT, NUDIX family n=1 Tax=Pelagibacterium luteolum TaxID=440168 RepID=A0A1G7YK91_9HYPH|nr:NUDIX domain-containing protein [Pelagibacterium luteolum]SDG96982.1 8-oxo-dGTP pyrophosphatase MutT, NUDIX family [Pelagibacterium luteolum]
MIEKVCALPYRETSSALEVLSFLHPLAGRQFVKGTLETYEQPAIGAERELREESGLSIAASPILLGRDVIGFPPVPWHFYAFETTDLPDVSNHWTEDGGGLLFSFFWHPLDRDLNGEWHPIFHQAYRTIRASLPLIVRSDDRA